MTQCDWHHWKAPTRTYRNRHLTYSMPITLTCQYRHGIGSQLYKCPGLGDLWINNLWGRKLQVCGFRKLHIFWCTTRLKASMHCIACVLSHFSHVWPFVTTWTITCEAPLSMRKSRQEYWNGLSCPPLGDLPDPGIKPVSLMSPALARGFFNASTNWEDHVLH